MADDFANNWGASYVLPDLRRQSTKRKAVDSYISSDKRSEIELRAIIKNTTHGYFNLEKLTPNGSDANLFAITSLCNGDTHGVLIGCGSYVAGDLGPLQPWSTADFCVNEGPSYIHEPTSNDISVSARSRTIALPYCIEGVMGERGQISYEDLCLQGLHKRCIYQEAIGQRVTVLFLELLLASNGCTLSNRFLKRVGLLSKHHDFHIIVDEILTGARMDTMLLTMNGPKEFIDRVAFVTLGKWCKCGVVLSGYHYDSHLQSSKNRMDPRGVTTGLNCSNPLPYFRKVQELLPTIPDRRTRCISKFTSMSSHETWGIGLIIFIPRRCLGTRAGTKNRLLPLLNNTPPDNIKSIPEPTWSRASVSRRTLSCVLKWTNQVSFISSNFSLDSKILCLYHMICFLVEHHVPGGWITSSELHEQVTKASDEHEQESLRFTTSILRAIERCGYLRKQMKTHRRLHGWSIISDRLNYPWQVTPIEHSPNE